LVTTLVTNCSVPAITNHHDDGSDDRRGPRISKGGCTDRHQSSPPQPAFAARVEQLTKTTGDAMLLTHGTLDARREPRPD
jgi:hypothetical protein